MLYISEICVRISIYSFQIFSFGQSKLYWQCKFINLLFSVQVLCAWFLFTFLFPDNQLSFRAKSCGQLFTAAIVSLWNRLHLTWPPQPINRVQEEGWKDNNAHPDKSPPSSRADKSPPRTICPFSPLMVSLSAIINPPRPISTALAWGQPGDFAFKLYPDNIFYWLYKYIFQRQW